MTQLEAADKIEAIVGATRHPTHHLARAVSAEQRVYMLHSSVCVARGIDLRECPFSVALDTGIDLRAWRGFQDRPVQVVVDGEHNDLLPLS